MKLRTLLLFSVLLMPEKRDQLLNYIEKSTGEENQIIVIMHLK
jgi:hypothetical protein